MHIDKLLSDYRMTHLNTEEKAVFLSLMDKCNAEHRTICKQLEDKGYSSAEFSIEQLHEFGSDSGYYDLMDAINEFSSLKNCEGRAGTVTNIVISGSTFTIEKRRQGDSTLHAFDILDSVTTIETLRCAKNLLECFETPIRAYDLLLYTKETELKDEEDCQEPETLEDGTQRHSEIDNIADESDKNDTLPTGITDTVSTALNSSETKSVELNIKIEKFEKSSE